MSCNSQSEIRQYNFCLLFVFDSLERVLRTKHPRWAEEVRPVKHRIFQQYPYVLGSLVVLIL